MRCSECGGEGNLYTEVEGNARDLCHQCFFRPDECLHDNVVANLARPITANERPAMLGVCTACHTVRELPSLTGDPQELFEAGRDIDAHVARFGDSWYISRRVPLIDEQDGWPDEPFVVGPSRES